MEKSKIILLRKKINVIQIPDGNNVTLNPGQEVFITQELGSNFTLNFMGNLFLLDGKDADAIDKKKKSYPVINI